MMMVCARKEKLFAILLRGLFEGVNHAYGISSFLRSVNGVFEFKFLETFKCI